MGGRGCHDHGLQVLVGAAQAKGCSTEELARAAIRNSANPKQRKTSEELANNATWKPKWNILNKNTFNRQKYM